MITHPDLNQLMIINLPIITILLIPGGGQKDESYVYKMDGFA